MPRTRKAGVLEPDLCIIGAGAAGLAVAFGAAALQTSVVLIEKGEMGGARRGAIALNLLIAAAKRRKERCHDRRFGFAADGTKTDYAAIRAEIAASIAALARSDQQVRFEGLGAKILRAGARFVNREMVEAGGQLVRARRFVLATGSRPAPAQFPGLELVRHFTPASLFDLAEFPRELVIIGNEPAAVEIAQAFARLGSQVVVLDPGRALSQVDEELARIALEQVARDGVALREAVSVKRIEPRGAGVEVVFSDKSGEASITGSHLLLALGRKPNVEGLGLDLAGIAYDDRGIDIGVDLRSRTNRRVYAIGDVAGGPPSLHGATYHARIVLRAALFRRPGEAKAAAVPWAIHTDPAIAWVGASEENARRQHRHIRILRVPFAENDRAVIDGDTIGHAKVITGKSGVVLGAGLVGAGADELLAPWTLAVAKGLKVGDLGTVVSPYPSRSEVLREAAAAFLLPALRNPWVRRMLAALRRFG